jgi:5-methylcytosine-specific restriction endonuclease McrA
MATTHENCCNESREFCDALLQSLCAHIPNAQRASTSTCAFFVPGSNRFAHLYHKKDSLLAIVYLRADDPDLIPHLSNEVSFQLREKMGSKWSDEFPTLIHIPLGSSSDEVAERLITYSLPLSGKKSRTQNSVQRFNDVMITDGKPQTILSTRYERSKALRAICLLHYGYQCQGCDLLLADRYGDIASKLIHVHHIERLADTGERVIDPKVDLVPLCPNCHAVVHLRQIPLSLSELRNLLVR